MKEIKKNLLMASFGPLVVGLLLSIITACRLTFVARLGLFVV